MLSKKITLSAVLIALATVLSYVIVWRLPNGGTVTLASMVPIILIGYLFGSKWGIMSALVYSLIQMIQQGISAPPVQNVGSYILVILLDYVIAYTVLGLSGNFFKLLGKRKFAIPVAGGIVVALRFVCHYLSGIIIWGVYAPEGQSPALYSLLYNGSYMGVEFIVTVIVLTILTPFILKQLSKSR